MTNEFLKINDRVMKHLSISKYIAPLSFTFLSALTVLSTSLLNLQQTAASTATLPHFEFPFPTPAWRVRPVAVPLAPLPTLEIDPNRVTVSGVSSGGFMAVQLHVAYSSVFNGAASVAGGIYECSKGNVSRGPRTCMNSPKSIVVKDHVEIARERAKKYQIDDPTNLRNDRIAIFASPKDLVIKQAGSDKLQEFYESFLPQSSIVRLTHPDAAHGLPTLSYGNPCRKMGKPWLLNCQFDLVGQLLGAIEPEYRALKNRGVQDLSNLIFFDQTKIVGANAHMYSWGAIYVPRECRLPGVACGVHVALHGCQMNPDFIQTQFIENAGYNEWAESNRLVVLYPQSAKGSINPYGCWDCFGFTGAEYTQKNGPQIKAIREILRGLGLK